MRRPREAGSAAVAPRRTFVLLALDPATGAATRMVAVAGTEGPGPDGRSAEALSWVPLEFVAAGVWRERLASATAPLAEALAHWAEAADGIASDVVEVDAPPSPDLAGAVEALMDEILATPGEA